MKKRTSCLTLSYILCWITIGYSNRHHSHIGYSKPSKYAHFPDLQDNLQCNNFLLHRITETSKIEISYFPYKNFFLVFNSKKAGHFQPIKIDSAGNVVLKMELTEQNSQGIVEVINRFLIGTNTIYDLSDDHPNAIPFSAILNKDINYSKIDWVSAFETMYSTSDIVIYSRYADIPMANVVYFRNKGQWIKLYSSEQDRFLYSGTHSEVICEINNRKIPQKLPEVHYLKDVQTATYSNAQRYKESEIIHYDTSFFPDQKLQYSQVGSIKTLGFSKEKAYIGPYNPGIPTKYYGTGFYALVLDNCVINFKTIASKKALSGDVKNNPSFIWSTHKICI